MGVERYTASVGQKVTRVLNNTNKGVAIEAPRVIKDGSEKSKAFLNNIANVNKCLVQTVNNDVFQARMNTLTNMPSIFARKIARLDEVKYQRALELIRRDANYHYIVRIVDASEDIYKDILRMMDKGVDAYSAWQIAGITDKVRYGNANKLLDKGMSGYHACSISELEQKQIDRVFGLIDEDKLKNGFCIERFAKLDDEKFKDIKNFLKNDIDAYGLCDVSYMEGEQYKRVVDLLSQGADPFFIEEVVNLENDVYQKAAEIVKKGASNHTAVNIAKMSPEQYDKVSYLISRGIRPTIAQDASNLKSSSFDVLIKLLDSGVEFDNARTYISKPSVAQELIEELKNCPNVARDFLESVDYSKKIKKASQGAYQKEMVALLDQENMHFGVRRGILINELEEKDILNSIKKLSTSTYKKAMATPNQYLSGIDEKYTTKIGNSYPKLPAIVLLKQQRQINEFFAEHFGEMIRALKYIDTDTLNQMMDKRTDIFGEMLAGLDELSDESYEVLSKLIGCVSAETGKVLTAKDKIDLCQIVQIYQKANLDDSSLFEMIKTNKVDLNKAKEQIQNEIFKKAGVSKEELAKISVEKKKFNEDYFYLALKSLEDEASEIKEEIEEEIKQLRKATPRELGDTIKAVESRIDDAIRIITFNNGPDSSIKEVNKIKETVIEVFRNSNKYTDKEIKEVLKQYVEVLSKYLKPENELYTVIREAALGDFNKFISNPSNKFGKMNQATQEKFNALGLNFNKWMSPNIGDVSFELANKKMTIKMWDRNPQEDLFMGNKTTCCTAIGTGCNADATPEFLLNKGFNVIEMFDDKGKQVGMSRVFMATVDGKPSLIMDNIEISNNFLKEINYKYGDKKVIAEKFIEYMNQYAKEVIGEKDANVHFSTKFCHFDDYMKNFKTREVNSFDFIGDTSQDRMYFNVIGDWGYPHNLIEKDKIKLYDVTQK